MATLGKSERKGPKNAVLADLLSKYHIEREENSKKEWDQKWNWLIQEYRDLQARNAEITKKSDLLAKVEHDDREKDLRDVKPIPPTTNGLYGWVSTRPDFKLDKYGKDVYKPMPLPEDLQMTFGPSD